MITADTNIFVYASDRADPRKKQTADAIVTRLVELGSQIGLQVVGEFQNVGWKKLGLPAADRAEKGRTMLAAFETFLPSRSAAERAIEHSAAGKLSYWDALLLASAAEAGCSTMLSEDMKDDETYFGVRVINPFTDAGALSDPARELLSL